MRSIAAPALVLAVILVSGPSEAQIFYPPFESAFGDSFTFLQDDAVCKHLKVSDDQIPKTTPPLMPMRKHYDEEIVKLHETPIFLAELQYPALAGKPKRRRGVSLDGVLQPDQMKRFRQIVFQRRRSAVFDDPKVLKQLGMTDDQKAEAAKFEKERKKESNRDGVDADALEKLEAKQVRKTVDIMTGEQKKVRNDLTGDPFEVKPGLLLRIRKVKVK